MRKLLFLDGDGVLMTNNFAYARNTDSLGHEFDPVCLMHLCRVLRYYKPRVIITSSHRLDRKFITRIKGELIKFGMSREDVDALDITKTPHYPEKSRREEINHWIAMYHGTWDIIDPWKDYLILDDQSVEFMDCDPLIKTTYDYGLTYKEVNEIQKYWGDIRDLTETRLECRMHEVLSGMFE